ncbi:MAG: pilus assembly protein [Candidatus Omnitrophica bacterium]|nr:pilus assembly protein [Candidatus Omnitrophota bacterium]
MKLWAPWATGCKKGQAILELAVFGSILIMLLGVLVSYGLKYNFQQQVMQEAFRKALGVTAVRHSTYVLIKDRHIPDPSNPFGIGAVVPAMSSASVTRDYRLHETADTEDELPRLYLDINGDIRAFKTTDLSGGQGEILNYDTCKTQCFESGNAEWYCDKLDILFPDGESMGVQQDYVQDMKVNSGTERVERASGITTADNVNWQGDIKRTIVYRPYGDETGNTVKEEIVSSVSQNQTYEWETPF